MSVLLFGLLFIWIYISTNHSLHEQQSLNIQLNNQNSAQVIEDTQESLLKTLHQLANRHAANFTSIKDYSLNIQIPDEVTSLLDLLRFHPLDNSPAQNADSPFFDFELLNLSEELISHGLLDTCKLLEIEGKRGSLFLIAASTRVIHPFDGRVYGYLIGGIVLNDNLPLMREILQRSNAELAIMDVAGQTLSSSSPIPPEVHASLADISRPITRGFSATESNRDLLISTFTYSFGGAPVNIRFVYNDEIFSRLQKTFINSAMILLVTTAALFFLFYTVARKKAQNAMSNLLLYTNTVADSPDTARYTPGKLTEFNKIGSAIDIMVQKLSIATGELKEIKERLELVIAGADLGTWDWNIDTGAVTFDSRWCQMLGYAGEEIVPDFSSWEKLIHPEDKQHVMQALNHHLEGKNPLYMVEHRLRHRSGHWVWILTGGKVLQRSESGAPLRAAGIHLDISKQKSAEEALAQERALLESMINSIPDLIFYKDRQSVYIGCNKAFEKLVDKSSAEIIGKTDFDLFPQELADFFRKQDREMLAIGGATRNEDWVTYPDSESVLLDTLKTPFVGPDNTIMGLIGVSRDITAIKETETKLEAERERLSVTLRSIGDGVITTDIDGNVVLLNKVAEELTGWKSEEARGLPSQDIFRIYHAVTGEMVVNPAETVVQLGKTIVLEPNVVLVSRNGKKYHIADSGAPIHDRQSNIIGAVIVFRDITDQQRLEEEILKTRKLESIGVLAGGIAHDFNNILSAILGNLELCSVLLPRDLSKPRTLLENAQKATSRAAKLTQQLLTFSKGGEPVKEATSLPGLIQESADFVLHGSKIFCQYSFPDDLWLADADTGQLSQVIQNIILNAKHAMPEGGKIQVRACNIDALHWDPILKHEGNDFVKISITDQGIGMPQDILDKIFDPYFTTKDEGSGLGLAISHSIITKHGGHLTVQSSPGVGTTFDIYLRKAERAPQNTQHPLPGQYEPLSLRVMVMDDEEMIRTLAHEQLCRLGHRPVLTQNGEETLERYRKMREAGEDVDVVILDLTIKGGMGGLDTSRALLAYDPNARIIVASGYSNDPVMSRYTDYGIQGAVIKPFDIDTLGQAIIGAAAKAQRKSGGDAR